MKKHLIWDFLLVLTIGICFSSCEDKPEASVIRELSVESGDNISFRGQLHLAIEGRAYELVDLNRLCKDRKTAFRVTKSTKIIESADRCDRCDRTWYNHIKTK